MISEFWQESYRDVVLKSKYTDNTRAFTNKVLTDIKKELQNSDKKVKSHALLKLLYLHSHNLDIKWASINTLEIIATCGAFGKRIGYTVGQLQFKNNKEHLQLIPNLVLKEMSSQNNTNISLALSFLNSVLNENLAITIISQLEQLLNVNNPNIRKKLILTLMKAHLLIKNKSQIEKFLLHLSKMLDKADTLTTGELISITSSIQEICSVYPKLVFTIFIPIWNFFKSCENNWILIKLIDIFSMLCSKVCKELLQTSEIVNYFGQLLKKNNSKSVEAQLVKLLILNLNNEKYMDLFLKCEERLKLLINYSDINLVLIALRILKELFQAGKLNKTSKSYMKEILKIIDKGQKERVKEYNSLKEKCKNNPSIPIIAITGNANSDKVHAECLEIISYSVDESNFKEACEKILESVGLTRVVNLIESNNKNVINTKIETSLILNDSDSNILPSSVLALIDKTCSVKTFIEIVSKNKYSILNNELNNFNWLIEKCFIIANDQYDKPIQKEIGELIRDMTQRIKVIRIDIINNSIELINKIIKNEVSKYNNISNIKLSDNEIKYYPLVEYFNNNTNTIYRSYLLDSLFFIIGEYVEDMIDNNKDILVKLIRNITQILNSSHNYNENSVNSNRNNYFCSLSDCVIKIISKCFSYYLNNKDDFFEDLMKSFVIFTCNNKEEGNLSYCEQKRLNNIFCAVFKIFKETKEGNISILMNEYNTTMKLIPLDKNAYSSISFEEIDDIEVEIDETELQVQKKIKKKNEIKKIQDDETNDENMASIEKKDESITNKQDSSKVEIL